MFQKYKLSVLLMISIILLTYSNPVYSLENTEQDVEQQSLDLNTTIETALNNSSRLELAKLEEKIAETKYEQAKDVKETIDDLNLSMTQPGSLTNENVLQQQVLPKKINNELAKMNWELSKLYIDQTRLSVENEVINLYLSLLELEEGVQLANANVERTEENFKNIKKKYDQGLLSKNELLDSEVMYEQAKFQLSNIKTEQKLSIQKLNQLLGNDLNQKIVLEPIQLNLNQNVPDFKNLIENAKKNRPDYLAAQKSYEIELIRQEAIKNLVSSKENFIQRQQVNKAEIQLKQIEEEIIITVSELLERINLNQQQFIIAEKNKEKAEESYRLAKLRYENGLGTSFELLSSQISLREAEKDYNATKYNLLRVKMQLEKAINMKLFSVEEE